MKKKLKTAFSTRQHMVSDDFEIYYYNDNNISSVSYHSHDYYELYFFLEGDVKMNINEKVSAVKIQDFLIIPPNIEHAPVYISQNKPYRRFVLWISKKYYESLKKKSDCYSYMIDYVNKSKEYIFHNDAITFNHIQSMIFGLIEVLKNKGFASYEMSKLNINSLILYLNRLVYEKNTGKSYENSLSLYNNILSYISQNLDKDLSLNKLADHFFVSRYHISHIFTDNMGISIHQYIITKRLKACKEAIASGNPITKVPSEYGFNDYSSFYRAFKKEFGISPSKYKKNLNFPDEFT